MDVDDWAEFGKNRIVADDFDYFPEKWINPNESEEFVNYALKYRNEFNHGENFRVLDPVDFLDSVSSKYSGFYKLRREEIVVNGFPHGAEFAFLQKGVLKYSQKKHSGMNDSQIFSQTFYDGPFFLKKIYYKSGYDSDSLKLSNVSRGERFFWNGGYSGGISQFGKNNFEVLLYNNFDLNSIIGFHLNSRVFYRDQPFVDKIKKDFHNSPKKEDFFNLLNEMWNGGVKSTRDWESLDNDPMDSFISNIY